MRRRESPFSASALSDDSTPRFRTNSVAFVAALLAADQLEYVGAERSANGREVEFILEDPNKIATELQRRYNAGIFPSVNPKLHMEARGFLMNEVNRVREGRNVQD